VRPSTSKSSFEETWAFPGSSRSRLVRRGRCCLTSGWSARGGTGCSKESVSVWSSFVYNLSNAHWLAGYNPSITLWWMQRRPESDILSAYGRGGDQQLHGGDDAGGRNASNQSAYEDVALVGRKGGYKALKSEDRLCTPGSNLLAARGTNVGPPDRPVCLEMPQYST
jgi:hypothetical protein